MISPSYAPAFINIAPPTVPGIPAANSRPVREFFVAADASAESLRPAPAYIFKPSILIVFKFYVEITAPSIPLSDTRRFEPLPIIK